MPTNARTPKVAPMAAPADELSSEGSSSVVVSITGSSFFGCSGYASVVVSPS